MLFLLISAFISSSRACMQTYPGPTTTTTTISPAEPCCPINIDDPNSTGRSVYDPAVEGCPSSANFICNVPINGQTSATHILLNGMTEVATGANGANSRITLMCRQSDSMWTYQYQGNEIVVNKVTCNTP